MSYNIYERAKCTIWYGNSKSYVLTKRQYKHEFGKNATCPSEASIKKWHENFLNSGTLQASKRRARRTATCEEKKEEVRQHFLDNPHSSLRSAESVLEISRESIRRLLKEMKWHPYKIQTVQQLYVEDKECRLDFANDELFRLRNDPNRLNNLVFSDECHFSLDATVNRHNCRYWSETNPNWFIEKPLHSPRTTVWAAIGIRTGIIGPFFFDDNVNKENYLAMLQNSFWPTIMNSGLNEDIIFMQDGAPPHWGRNVRDWLNKNLEDRWIGRGSPNMPWPPRSPDITACDFFLWGYLKSKVYETKPENMEDLKGRISQCCQNISEDLITRVLKCFQIRLETLTQNNGSYIEVTIDHQ